MDDYLDGLCDELDAVVFSGDMLHDEETLKEFKAFLKRWKKESGSIKEMLEERKKENEGS